MLADVVKAARPLSAEIEGDFAARGGISTKITARFERSRKRAG
jgi:NADPH-dependent 7-cyano-7-deazaguanine reductase QueF